MIKKLQLMFATLFACLPMFATDMCVEKSDGSVVRFKVDDVNKVYYDESDGSSDNVVDASTSNFKFFAINDNEVEVTGIINGSVNMVVPEKVNISGKVYTVTGIGKDAFYKQSKIESITLPKTITSIGSSAFQYCSDLKNVSVEIPSNLASIGWCAFEGCLELTTINIPEGVTSIANDAFRVCTNLTNIEIPSSVTSIGKEAFYECKNAEIVIYNGNVNVEVGEHAFYYCKSELWVGKKITYKDIEVSGQVDDYGYIDLRLPSGLKWATLNIGATNIEDYGNYYAWGEFNTKSDFSDENSTTYGKDLSELMSKGVIDSNYNITEEYDAATQNWGKNWRMPTSTEYDELLEYCTWEWVNLNGVCGYKVSSKVNENWIFLPAAGYREGTSGDHVGSDGYYWSSIKDGYGSRYAYYLFFSSGGMSTGSYSRSHGRSVRPVVKE